jgi:hypothetical protein
MSPAAQLSHVVPAYLPVQPQRQAPTLPLTDAAWPLQSFALVHAFETALHVG